MMSGLHDVREQLIEHGVVLRNLVCFPRTLFNVEAPNVSARCEASPRCSFHVCCKALGSPKRCHCALQTGVHIFCIGAVSICVCSQAFRCNMHSIMVCIFVPAEGSRVSV